MTYIFLMSAAVRIDTIFKTLADSTRRGMFEEILRRGEVTVGALAAQASVSQPAVSQHLRALREAGLVSERKAGRNVHYRPAPHGMAPLVDWLGLYATFWRERFDNLDRLLKQQSREKKQ